MEAPPSPVASVDLRDARLRSLSAGVLSALGFDVRSGVQADDDACLFVIEAGALERVLAAAPRRELQILVVGEPAAEPPYAMRSGGIVVLGAEPDSGTMVRALRRAAEKARASLSR
jgi:hypothetical protein